MENIILNEDCFDAFKKISNNSVDFVCVDLPYGCLGIKWDKIIDLEKMWVELKRILKPNGQCAFFCTTKFGNTIINSNPKWFRYDIVWEKTNSVGFLNAKHSLMRTHEMIYLFHNNVKPKDLKWTYNPQKTEGKPYIRKGKGGIRHMGPYERKGDKMLDIDKINEDGKRYPKSIIKIGYDTEKIHPTQKPIELLEWLIKTYSNENDMVLDFTAGSCGVAVAAINTNRRYICVEKEKEYFDKAQQRIQNINNNLNINTGINIIIPENGDIGTDTNSE